MADCRTALLARRAGFCGRGFGLAGAATGNGTTASLGSLGIAISSWFSPLSSAPAARQDFTGGRRQDRKQSRRRFGLFEDEGNATRRLCGIENLCAVGFAVHPEPLGEANDYVLPRDI